MFLDPGLFPIVEILEDNWEAIRDEVLALPDGSFDPWIQQGMHGSGWSVYGLIAAGHPIPGGTTACPKTAAILDLFDGVGIAGFSRMAPGTHILPHAGWAQNEYRLHLGLIVPKGCRLQVGDETQHWQEGKCLIFDDTVVHEAWNNSDQVRTNLMVDFLRPGETEFSQFVPDDVRKYAENLFDDQPDD